MRRSVTVAFGLSALLMSVTGSVSPAATSVLPPPSLQIELGGVPSPQALPAHEYAPITAEISGSVRTTDGTHPSALREMVLDVDKDVRIGVEGLPVCGERRLVGRNTEEARRACRAAKIGGGVGYTEIVLPDQAAAIVKSRITVFNAGEAGGKITLLIHTFLTVPSEETIVTRVTIQRMGTGLHSVARIPPIAGGAGSTVSFRFELGRSYSDEGAERSFLMARCPDGVFKVNTPKILFKNEAQTPGVAASTVFKGGLAVPCTPKG